LKFAVISPDKAPGDEIAAMLETENGTNSVTRAVSAGPELAMVVNGSTPDVLVAEWNRQIRAELAQPETIAELTALSLDVESSTPEELKARVRKNLEQWTSRMEQFGMKPAD